MENAQIVTSNTVHSSTKVYRLNFFLVAIVAVVANVVQFTFLPSHVFNDSYRILGIMLTNPEFVFQSSFQITALWSNAINIFELDSLIHWSIKFALIFNPLIYLLFRKIRISSFMLLIWAYAAIGILNIFVFNLSKDVFQFALFLIIFIILQSRLKLNTKVAYCILLLLAWGFIFRIYFGLIAGYSLMIYLLFVLYAGMKIRRVFLFAIMMFAGVWLSLFVLSMVAPEEYSVIFEIRRRVNYHRVVGEFAHRTVIVSLVPYGNSLLMFMVNYVINVFRMMFPIELLVHFELRIWLFFAFQISLAYIVVKNIKSVLKKAASPKKIIAISLYIGYLLGSALFEPDFGSWIRHSATLFPIFMILVEARLPIEGRGESDNYGQPEKTTIGSARHS